ncbi:hypothetical protein SSX86_000538 [Deinandra increscens subsp. villosa]|uniref:Uncharacterized protein n=1 Tax=Deinandra increscens subsp. villosa TaxID=3103831 RepID=A0AAP0DWN3_9ASTR
MVEERAEVVYDINPCRYLQQVFSSFLRCLGLENQGEEGNISGGGGAMAAVKWEEMVAVAVERRWMIYLRHHLSWILMNLFQQLGIVRRRPPPRGRGPISSGGPGQTN